MTNLTQTQVNINKAREEAIAAESEGGIYYIPDASFAVFPKGTNPWGWEPTGFVCTENITIK